MMVSYRFKKLYLVESSFAYMFLSVHIYPCNYFFSKQYLPHVVPLAFSSCNLDDGSAVDIDESDD